MKRPTVFDHNLILDSDSNAMFRIYKCSCGKFTSFTPRANEALQEFDCHVKGLKPRTVEEMEEDDSD